MIKNKVHFNSSTGYSFLEVVFFLQKLRQNINKFLTKSVEEDFFSDQPKPFILHCPLPESHQNLAPASVSLVQDKINTF